MLVSYLSVPHLLCFISSRTRAAPVPCLSRHAPMLTLPPRLYRFLFKELAPSWTWLLHRYLRPRRSSLQVYVCCELTPHNVLQDGVGDPLFPPGSNVLHVAAHAARKHILHNFQMLACILEQPGSSVLWHAVDKVHTARTPPLLYS